jgi:glycine dehydrogenase subunit 1
MDFRHPYLPITQEDEETMLKSIGRASIEELFSTIPEKYRLKRELKIPDSHSELDVTRRIQELASKNRLMGDGRMFLGSGVGIHYIPAAVRALAGRSEFVTAYTSYQPEISQGMLQTLFEYQSLMAELLDVDVVNSSMYDMASGLAEAARMAVRVGTHRSRILIPSTIDPRHYKVLLTYTEPANIEIQKVEFDPKTGLMSTSDLKSKIDESVAAVYVENPSYLGFLETQVDSISRIVHDAGALLIAGVDILSLGIVRPPGSYGADIVVGEGQELGSSTSYGGPLLGVFGCNMDRKLVYQMPGRLVGMTRTMEEPYERGFVLTLSPREQHIRREKATSNICSNEALAAVTSAIYLSLLGPAGIRQVGETIAYRSNYAAKELGSIPGVVAPAIGKSIWKEFVVKFEKGLSARAVHEGLLARNLHGGTILTNEFPTLGESMLFSVTEVHSKPIIDELVKAIKDIVARGGRR